MKVICLLLSLFLVGCNSKQTRVPINDSYSTMVMEELIIGDIDNDGNVDSHDIAIFEKVIGECDDGDNYNSLADADHDGCITLKDKKILFPEILE